MCLVHQECVSKGPFLHAPACSWSLFAISSSFLASLSTLQASLSCLASELRAFPFADSAAFLSSKCRYSHVYSLSEEPLLPVLKGFGIAMVVFPALRGLLRLRLDRHTGPTRCPWIQLFGALPLSPVKYQNWIPWYCSRSHFRFLPPHLC